MKPKEFIEKYLDAAKQSETETGTPYLLTLAQAALESGWGEHAPGNNFFGIKAGRLWKGKTQVLKTREVINGKKIFINDIFRAYDTPEECFKDHGVFLKTRFPKAFSFPDPVAFIFSVQNDHEYKYATDPKYVELIAAMIKTLERNLC